MKLQLQEINPISPNATVRGSCARSESIWPSSAKADSACERAYKQIAKNLHNENWVDGRNTSFIYKKNKCQPIYVIRSLVILPQARQICQKASMIM